MTDLIAEIQKAVDRKSDLFLHDAVATGNNTVTVGQSTVAVTLPAIIPVVSGDFCQVLEQGLNRVIIGPVGTAWATVTLGSANWTLNRTPEWRRNSGRIELRGYVTKTTAAFAPGSTLFTLGGSNPPDPGATYTIGGEATVAALTPDGGRLQWQVDSGAGTFRTASVTHQLAVGDSLSLDGIWWPA